MAIATALMPPLCTAGYGLARLNMHYFLGALLLFCINGIFIILATYLTVKYLHFKEVEFKDEAKARRDRRLITAIVLLVTIPSIWSAFRMVRDNRFDKNAEAFVAQNKTQRNSFIYDYRIDPRGGGRITLYFTGGALTAADKNALFLSAAEHGIKSNQLEFVEKNLGMDESETFEKMFKVIYDRTDSEIRLREEEIRKRDEEIRQLKEELSRLRDSGSVKAPVSAAAPASAPPAEEAPSGKP